MTRLRPAKLWTSCEVQGPGRRYWFNSLPDRADFIRAKREAGYQVHPADLTVWVSFARRPTQGSREQAAGRDPE